MTSSSAAPNLKLETTSALMPNSRSSLRPSCRPSCRPFCFDEDDFVRVVVPKRRRSGLRRGFGAAAIAEFRPSKQEGIYDRLY